MTTQRVLVLTYIVLGLLLALTLEQIYGGVFGRWAVLGFLNQSLLPQLGEWTWATALGFATAAGVGVWTWRSPKLQPVAVQVVEEMQRVTWPTLAETRAATVAVIVASVVCAAMLGLFDWVWSLLTSQVYNPQ